ncbi:MAG: hypothetical protein KH135_04635 [Firmicutes bacterium]|nr:hypothetical protein [Bacillota bacterium]
MNISEQSIIYIDTNYGKEKYDFNLYPIYRTPMEPQLFIVPSYDETEEDCYIVRNPKDKQTDLISHSKFAAQLVNNQIFQKREQQAYVNSNGKTKLWIHDASHEEPLEYLIEEKGFILFSPPTTREDGLVTIPSSFIPRNKSLLTKRQIANLFTMLDMNPNIRLDSNMETELSNILYHKKR